MKQSDIIVKKETLIVFSCFPSRNGKYIAFIVRSCFLNIECMTFYTLSCHRIFESEVGGESSSSPTYITQGGISSSPSLTESQTASASKACRDKDLTISQDHSILRSLDSQKVPSYIDPKCSYSQLMCIFPSCVYGTIQNNSSFTLKFSKYKGSATVQEEGDERIFQKPFKIYNLEKHFKTVS